MKKTLHLQRIVLVDDDQDDCELFGDALHEFDRSLKLFCLTDNERLAAFLEENAPQLIFLDVNMPRKNGYECLSEIRSLPQFNEIPVVMYSNTGRAEDINRAYKDGANLFLRKPSTFRDLVNALRQVTAKDWISPERVTAQYFSNGRYHPFS